MVVATVFESKELIKLLDALNGPTSPTGNDSVDRSIEYNLQKLIDVINWCLDGVNDAARYRTSFCQSERTIGYRAYGAMIEWRDWLNGQIEGDENG